MLSSEVGFFLRFNPFKFFVTKSFYIFFTFYSIALYQVLVMEVHFLELKTVSFFMQSINNMNNLKHNLEING